MSRTALITDSACYIPEPLVARYGIRVVPLNIQIGHESYEEPDLDADDFYRRLGDGATVTTSQPSPGQFLSAYEQAAHDGAESILSVHIGSTLSGTVQSAQIAAESVSIPVTIIDTGQASFAQGLCVLEAAEALEQGRSLEEAGSRASAASKVIGNTFVVRGMELMARGGRLAPDEESTAEGVPVMALTPEGLKVLALADTMQQAVSTMAGHIQAAAEAAKGRRLRVGIGHGAAPQIAEALRERVVAIKGVEKVIDYIVGPAVGAHVGPGNAGAVFLARPVAFE